MLGELGGKSSCTLLKMLVLAAIPVHETSLTNQHFYSMLREEVCKKYSLYACENAENYKPGTYAESLDLFISGSFPCSLSVL